MIHPRIASQLAPDSRIADIGTGTGIFLRQASEQLPETCRFDGFDVCLSQFPSQLDLPSNVRLLEQDVKKDFPPEFHGAYDLVHLRLMVTALQGEEWGSLCRIAERLLKPGGAIQWEEADHYHSTRLKGNARSSCQNLEHLARKFIDAMYPHFNFSYPTITTLYEQTGLVGILQDVVASDNVADTRAELTRLSYSGIFGWARMMSCLDALDSWSEAEVEELESACESDIRSGSYLRYDIFVTVGFKPIY